jgi:hypothetical protein
MGAGSVSERARRVVRMLAAVGCCALMLLCLGCSDTPQLGSEECLGAADALWTSVNAKNSDLLEQSAANIEKLHSNAELSDAAFEQLTDVIAIARKGDWSGARAALKKFVQGQRPVEHRS